MIINDNNSDTIKNGPVQKEKERARESSNYLVIENPYRKSDRSTVFGDSGPAGRGDPRAHVPPRAPPSFRSPLKLVAFSDLPRDLPAQTREVSGFFHLELSARARGMRTALKTTRMTMLLSCHVLIFKRNSSKRMVKGTGATKESDNEETLVRFPPQSWASRFSV